ncbi:MAG: cupin domain-containing protein [Nostoc sp.]|uniref:cupin domain-containing protein n=1 Tax=Nostoc sp. TaxID=1180 RepID=UPI002FFAE9C7
MKLFGVGVIGSLLLTLAITSKVEAFQFPTITPDPDAPSYLFYDGVPFTFIKRGETTNGQYTLRQTNVLKGQGVPPHIHQDEDEWLYVKEGNLQITVGDHIYGPNEIPGVNAPKDILHAIDAPAGTLIYGPRYRLHGVLNISDEPAKLLVAWNPPGFEDIFKAPGIIPVTDFSNLPTLPPNYPQIYAQAANAERGLVGSASYDQFGDLQYDNVVANEDNHGDELLRLIAAGNESPKPVPESSSSWGVLAFGALVAISIWKPKWKSMSKVG